VYTVISGRERVKKKVLLMLAFAFMLVAVPTVNAPTGTIRIEPALPLMLESPADFEIWVQGDGNPTSDPHILLVMTEACYTGLTDDVVVAWTGDSVNIPAGEFTAANTGYAPSSGTTTGGRYTVASLQDHIGVPHSEMIYYANASFPGPLTHTHQSFTVTLPSTDPRMLVYAIGKTEGAPDNLFNSKVPPTIPGFVIPELAPILLVIASFSAFILYMAKPKKYH